MFAPSLAIPKTAGTTLRKIVDNQYHASEIIHCNDKEQLNTRLKEMNKKDIGKLKCVQGHHPLVFTNIFHVDFLIL